MIAVAQGENLQAVRLSGAALKLREETNSLPLANEGQDYESSMAVACDRLETQVFQSSLNEGRSMSLPEIISYATESQ